MCWWYTSRHSRLICTPCTGPKGRSGKENLASPPSGFDPRTVQPVAQSLYRLSYPGPLLRERRSDNLGSNHEKDFFRIFQRSKPKQLLVQTVPSAVSLDVKPLAHGGDQYLSTSKMKNRRFCTFYSPQIHWYRDSLDPATNSASSFTLFYICCLCYQKQ